MLAQATKTSFLAHREDAFDKVISFTIYRATGANSLESVVSFDYPETGPKPNIRLKFSLLPDQTTTTTVDLTVSQLVMSTADLDHLIYMEITAGYSTGQTRTLRCPIWSVSPKGAPPNTEYTFHCLVAGQLDLNGSVFYKIYLHDKTIVIGDYCEKLLHEAEYAVDIKWPETRDGVSLKDIEVTNHASCLFAKSRIQIAEWVGDFLKQCVHELINTEDENAGKLYVTIDDDVFFARMITNAASDYDDTEKVVPVHTINTLSFSGVIANITAPWNPDVIPGSIIHCPTRFYDQTVLPNTATVKSFKDEFNLYRVLMMDVDFDTAGATNRMSLQAMSLKYLNESFTTKVGNDTLTTMQTTADSMTEKLKNGEIPNEMGVVADDTATIDMLNKAYENAMNYAAGAVTSASSATLATRMTEKVIHIGQIGGDSEGKPAFATSTAGTLEQVTTCNVVHSVMDAARYCWGDNGVVIDKSIAAKMGSRRYRGMKLYFTDLYYLIGDQTYANVPSVYTGEAAQQIKQNWLNWDSVGATTYSADGKKSGFINYYVPKFSSGDDVKPFKDRLKAIAEYEQYRVTNQNKLATWILYLEALDK